MNTNTYTIEKKGRGGNYNHKFHLTTAEEMANWDGIVAHDINKNIAYCWVTAEHDNDYENRFDPIIHDIMTFH